MKIGNHELKNNIFLGPMAGVTDKVYRKICSEYGCDVTITEMVSAKAIYYNNKKTNTLIDIDVIEKCPGVQLFGSDSKLMGEMAKKIDNDSIKFFDINMGCPVPKVVNNGEGSALMKNPKLVGEIVETMVKSLNKPVSVKIRTGFDESNINALEIAHIAQESGASHIVIHGRTREQYYSGKADWETIRLVKESLNIPVIANGDVTDGKSFKEILKYTNCDGVMIGRAAMGNPWVFAKCIASISGKNYIEPTRKEIIDLIIRHARELVAYKGEYIAIREMRKHVGWYTKGLKNATKFRQEVNKCEELIDLIDLIK